MPFPNYKHRGHKFLDAFEYDFYGSSTKDTPSSIPKNDEKNLIRLHFKIGKSGFPSFLTYSEHTLGVGQHVGMFAKTPPVSLFQQYVNNIGESSSCHPRKYKTSAILENKRLSTLDNTHQEMFIKSIRYHLNRDPDRALCKIIIGRPSGV